jgi:hypothetical protein
MKIGATALCRWADNKEEREYYFSFGHYDEATESDGFGVDDGNIFFYCSEAELIAMVGKDCSEGELVAMVGGDSNDFQVLEILNYTEKGEE